MVVAWMVLFLPRLRRGRNRTIQSTDTKHIYDEAISTTLDGVLDGFNATVLAYGATGCGKTYTYISVQAEWWERAERRESSHWL